MHILTILVSKPIKKAPERPQRPAPPSPIPSRVDLDTKESNDSDNEQIVS